MNEEHTRTEQVRNNWHVTLHYVVEPHNPLGIPRSLYTAEEEKKFILLEPLHLGFSFYNDIVSDSFPSFDWYRETSKFVLGWKIRNIFQFRMNGKVQIDQCGRMAQWNPHACCIAKFSCVHQKNHINIYIFFESVVLRQGRKGTWYIYKLIRNEVTKHCSRRDDFCHHYFTGKFYIIKALSFWWYMILIKHHDDHDDVYVSPNISSEWYLWNDLSGQCITMVTLHWCWSNSRNTSLRLKILILIKNALFLCIYFNEKWSVLVCQLDKKKEITYIKSVYLTPTEKVLSYKERFKCANQMNYSIVSGNISPIIQLNIATILSQISNYC